MRNFFKFFGNFLRAAPRVLLFEILLKLMLTAIGAPLLSLLLNLAMKSSGVSYITVSSLKKLLLNPVTILILILMLFIAAFFTIVELFSLVAAFAYSRERKKLQSSVCSGAVLGHLQNPSAAREFSASWALCLLFRWRSSPCRQV